MALIKSIKDEVSRAIRRGAILKIGFNSTLMLAMVGLEHQKAVRLLIEHLLRDLGLAAHGIEGEEAVFQVQDLQRKRERLGLEEQEHAAKGVV